MAVLAAVLLVVWKSAAVSQSGCARLTRRPAPSVTLTHCFKYPPTLSFVTGSHSRASAPLVTATGCQAARVSCLGCAIRSFLPHTLAPATFARLFPYFPCLPPLLPDCSSLFSLICSSGQVAGRLPESMHHRERIHLPISPVPSDVQAWATELRSLSLGSQDLPGWHRHLHDSLPHASLRLRRLLCCLPGVQLFQ